MGGGSPWGALALMEGLQKNHGMWGGGRGACPFPLWETLQYTTKCSLSKQKNVSVKQFLFRSRVCSL